MPVNDSGHPFSIVGLLATDGIIGFQTCNQWMTGQMLFCCITQKSRKAFSYSGTKMSLLQQEPYMHGVHSPPRIPGKGPSYTDQDKAATESMCVSCIYFLWYNIN